MNKKDLFLPLNFSGPDADTNAAIKLSLTALRVKQLLDKMALVQGLVSMDHKVNSLSLEPDPEDCIVRINTNKELDYCIAGKGYAVREPHPAGWTPICLLDPLSLQIHVFSSLIAVSGYGDGQPFRSERITKECLERMF